MVCHLRAGRCVVDGRDEFVQVTIVGYVNTNFIGLAEDVVQKLWIFFESLIPLRMDRLEL